MIFVHMWPVKKLRCQRLADLPTAVQLVRSRDRIRALQARSVAHICVPGPRCGLQPRARLEEGA